MTVSATLLGTLLHGVAASRPAANAVAGGTVYSATDTGAITQSDGSSWATFATISSGMADPMTTRGDTIVRNASNVTARLAVGAAGTFYSSDGTDVSWKYPALTVSENFITGDVTLTSANTFYDGPSLSLAAGTYLLSGGVVIYNGGSCYVAAKLWDGTTTYDSPGDQAGAGEQTQLAVAGKVVLAGTTTIKISAAANATGSAMLASVLNGVTNKASHLVAVRIA